MNIQNNLLSIRHTLPEGVKLVCVSKFHSIGEIMQAYECGERCFGENRPQELTMKQPQLPTDIEWHFIGNLQSNKVKQIVPIATLIESASSPKLMYEIEHVASKLGKVCRILLEVHVAQENSKQGFTPEELYEFITPDSLKAFPHLEICGVMGMATHTDQTDQIRCEFRQIVATFNNLKRTVFPNDPHFKEISMGMSSDYTIALEEGATIIRVGSAIFGPRNY